MLSQQRFKAQICEKPSLVVAHTLLFLPEIDHGKGWLLAQGPAQASAFCPGCCMSKLTEQRNKIFAETVVPSFSHEAHVFLWRQLRTVLRVSLYEVLFWHHKTAVALS